jgi:hypothetical protein
MVITALNSYFNSRDEYKKQTPVSFAATDRGQRKGGVGEKDVSLYSYYTTLTAVRFHAIATFLQPVSAW